jgi:hypothetical protein
VSAKIIDLAAERKARREPRDVPACIFLLPAHVAAFYAEAWLDALRRIEHALPRWPGGSDDLEV